MQMTGFIKRVLRNVKWIVLLCLSFAAHAQTPVALDPIIVSGSITDQDAPNHNATAVAIPENIPLSTSVSDIVGRTSGVHIQNYGGLEAATAVSIRGSTSSQVTIFLDDIPLESASDSGVGLQNLDAADLERIDIFKNFTPLDFGSEAIGGVVNLKSRAVAPGFSQKYTLSYGSFKTAKLRANVNYGGESNDVVFDLNYRTTDGDFKFLDNNGTPVNPSDDAVVTRQNNASHTWHPYFKWEHRFDPLSTLTFATHFFRVDAGVPGLASFQSQTASRSLTEGMGEVKFRRAGALQDHLIWQNIFYWRLIKTQFSDPNGEIGLGAAQDNDNKTVMLGNRVIGDFKFSENVSTKTSLEYAVENYVPKDFVSANPNGSSSTRQQVNVAAQPVFLFFEERLQIETNLRLINAFYKINNNDPSLAGAGSFFSNRTEHNVLAGTAWRFQVLPELAAKASVGRAVRLPKFSELFGDQGYVLGNPTLVSEKNLKWDAGLAYQKTLAGILTSLNFGLDYFESHVSDLIQFELANGVARANNLGKARVRGVEASGAVKFLKVFEVSENLTWQDARDLAVYPGNRLIGRPEWESNTGLIFEPKKFHFATYVNFIDNQYLDSLGTQKINNRVRLDGDASFQATKNVLVGLELKNITGSQIVDALGFPLPGRSIFGRVELKL